MMATHEPRVQKRPNHPRRRRGRGRLLHTLVALIATFVGAVPGHAQPEAEPAPLDSSDLGGESGVGGEVDAHAGLVFPAQPGEEATPAELEAFQLASVGRFIKARELAEAVLAREANSYVAHLTLGRVQHYGEANFPRALYHFERALRLYESRHGREPGPPAPWRWHAKLLMMLAQTHGDLEHHEAKLSYLARYDELYEPDQLAERAWPLMKLGRYDDARRTAQAALASGDDVQTLIALNALCAIEFEAGNDGTSYEACERALEHGRSQPGGANAVDLTNFSEASRSMFKLDEAERIGLEATTAEAAWYGNPWLELAELYTREARFGEALDALKRVHPYRAQRPTHVRDSDRNEGRRALAAFFLVMGRPMDAIRITDKALVAPDRRAHNSRDPAQDQAIVALLDRRARLLASEMAFEAAAAAPWYERPLHWMSALAHRLQAWMGARRVARLLADEARLVGTFRIGTAKSAIMPPWLAPELVDTLGAGVVEEAVTRARRADARSEAAPYYDAVEAEVALCRGDLDLALRLTTRALARMQPAEALLRARLLAIDAEARRAQGDTAASLAAYDRAFQLDPGVFRRFGWAVPVSLTAPTGALGERVADALLRSPRFDASEDGLRLTVDADRVAGKVCLLTTQGDVLGCAEARAERAETEDAWVARLVGAVHSEVFAPRVDLSQTDANSLDGSNRVSRNPLEELAPAGGLDGE